MFSPDAFNRAVNKVREWGSDLIALVPNLIVALLVLAIFVLLAKLVQKGIERALKRFSKHIQINELVAATARLVIMIAGLFIALGVLKLDKTVTSLLAGVGVIGLALGFAFKDIAANYMSGVIIALRVPFEIGDLVKIKDYFGTVHSLDLRVTGIRIPSGELAFIPNQEVLQNAIVNYTLGRERRVDLEVGVSYAEDLEKVRSVVLETLQALPEADKSRDVDVLFTGFGDSSIDFEARFWIHGVAQRDFLAARSAAVIAIKRAFDQHDITIPFPIRTLDFGIRGGEKLDEMLGSAAHRQPQSENGRGNDRPLRRQ